MIFGRQAKVIYRALVHTVQKLKTEALSSEIIPVFLSIGSDAFKYDSSVSRLNVTISLPT